MNPSETHPEQRDDVPVEAAGGVLWRRNDADEIEVAVIHRPKYDDWSLPKGKLEADEHPVLGALREIREETGADAVPGRPLGECRYLKDGRPKRVRYWAMRATNGGFSPTPEVDRLAWLTPEAATLRLDRERDLGILTTFAQETPDTWPVALVRHGSAGSRKRWDGPDVDRPLDERGRRQASALAGVLATYGVRELYAADVERCVATLRPLAERVARPVRTERLLSDVGYEEHPQAAVRWFMEVTRRGVPVVIASQGGPVPELVVNHCRQHGQHGRPLAATPKGGSVIVHLRDDNERPVVAVETWDPLA